MMELGNLALGVVLPEVSFAFEGGDGLPWTVLHVSLREALSELYECTLVLAGEGDPTPDGLLGGPAGLLIHRGASTRSLRGVVSFVEDLGSTATHRHVRVGVVPRLWLLSQRVDSRIFQEKTAVEIVGEVLRDAGVYQEAGALEKGAFGRLPRREYCVQYRETDLDFVRRLLQEEGIPFYFRHHGEASETLVLVDDPQRYSPVATMDGGALPVSDGAMNVMTRESVRWFDLRRELRPTGVTLREYDFTHPRARSEMTTGAPPGEAGPRAQYDYPAKTTIHRYDEERAAYLAHDGAAQARVRHERNQVGGVRGSGRGNVTGMIPGLTMTLAGHARGDLDGGYLVTRVEHRGQAWSDVPVEVQANEHLWQQLRDAGVQQGAQIQQRYTNQFEVIPQGVTFRPAKRVERPLVQGAQTARVVGPEGEEIHTDPHGRVKVQFHWDRVGSDDERSSCWVRVQQNWAGAGWGFQFIPRVGMEVVVTFLEGDPDRPLVTGCVYNGENGYPYGLPESKTRSGVKTNSSATNGGYNELRFEDRQGEEQVYVQAQRNMDTLVKHDQTLTVGRNRTKVVKGREKNVVAGDRQTFVNENELKVVDGNQTTEVHGSFGLSTSVDGHYHIKAGESVTVEIGASRLRMTRDRIKLQSQFIDIFAEHQVDIRGGAVKINCAPPEIFESLDQYEGGFTLLDGSGMPRPHVDYVIKSGSGREFYGTTDEQGRTHLVRTDTEEELEFEELFDAECGS